MNEDAKAKRFENELNFGANFATLHQRIRSTSNIRFSAARRTRFNYRLASLTITVLSLWAIAISYLLTTKVMQFPELERSQFEIIAVLLPIFILVFSLIDGGEGVLRSHQLEQNARHLREIADEMTSEYNAAKGGQEVAFETRLFQKYTQKYNDALIRFSAGHDQIDYFSDLYRNLRNAEAKPGWRWWGYLFLEFWCWIRRQSQRACYIALWLIPLIGFLTWPRPPGP